MWDKATFLTCIVFLRVSLESTSVSWDWVVVVLRCCLGRVLFESGPVVWETCHFNVWLEKDWQSELAFFPLVFLLELRVLCGGQKGPLGLSTSFPLIHQHPGQTSPHSNVLSLKQCVNTHRQVQLSPRQTQQFPVRDRHSTCLSRVKCSRTSRSYPLLSQINDNSKREMKGKLEINISGCVGVSAIFQFWFNLT